jgi:purine-nucleoside phosphorylase
MSTPHISAQKGDFAKTVLMPGDPLRAKFIATTYLTDAKLVTSVRNILGYTGFYKGKRISVMASGMGQPSIGIYSYELFTHFDVETIIRIGTCGTYREDINLFDLLIAVGASTDSNWSGQFDLKGGTFSAIADFELAMKAYHRVKDAGLPVHAGNILSSDVFYDIDPNAWKKWATLGIIGVEMESFALYVNAARLQKKALCLLTVTDQIVRGERATSEERELGLRKMIEVALDIAE